MLELNLGLLEEQEALLPTELSLQPHLVLLCFVCSTLPPATAATAVQSAGPAEPPGWQGQGSAALPEPRAAPSGGGRDIL